MTLDGSLPFSMAFVESRAPSSGTNTLALGLLARVLGQDSQGRRRRWVSPGRLNGASSSVDSQHRFDKAVSTADVTTGIIALQSLGCWGSCGSQHFPFRPGLPSMHCHQDNRALLQHQGESFLARAVHFQKPTRSGWSCQRNSSSQHHRSRME
ncbi:hypothetical protein FQN60_016328 [Etheostoma spectabile]|uniref:Uncharacterized protein n=1 Tax=Etheostoma spectabile TaxID=54343 RepID=A0A5J5D457_9PERO|nr:hypothetical protein FQN60_016328 [Etheostoma spectabile]